MLNNFCIEVRFSELIDSKFNYIKKILVSESSSTQIINVEQIMKNFERIFSILELDNDKFIQENKTMLKCDNFLFFSI